MSWIDTLHHPNTMQVNKYDIRFALEHLNRRKRAPFTNYTHSYLDALARQTLLECSADPHISEEAAQLAQECLLQPKTTAGSWDAALMELCKKIIIGGQEEDFVEMLQADPRKIAVWRSLWDKTRAKATKTATKKKSK